LPGEQVSIVQGDITELLSQLGLSELRAIAREYDITRTGMNKQQLVEAMVEVLKQPEMIRKVVGTLEKPQRQLLAALTLAGGTVTDEELRGLYERFSLGYPNQLQAMLSALRSKCLLFRTPAINRGDAKDLKRALQAPLRVPTQEPIGLMGSLLDVGWYVPSEVRAVLRVTVPTTPFEVQTTKAGNAEAPKLEEAKPYSLLNDLLLVARALDGRAEGDRKGRPSIGDVEGGGRVNRTMEARAEARTEASSRPYGLYAIPADGLMLVPPPLDMPSPSLLESLQVVVPRPAAFLLFTFRLLRLVDILYKDDAGTPYLRILPNAARLLLGPTCTEVAHDLFVRWLTQPTYAELFELQEEGLRLRCRSGPLGRPALRTGELEMDNSEARQMLVALLAKVPLNQWINFSAFARFVYRLNPAFLQRRHNLFSSPPWWLEQEEGRTLHPTQWNDWLRAEGRYIARLLRGPLHWWGISDVALSNSGQLLAFRLTPLASLLVHGSISAPQADRPRIIADSASNRRETTAWLMSSHGGREGFETRLAEGPYDQDAPQMLTLSENGDILISSSPVEWPLIELLEDFAEVAGVQAGRLCYRLTAASLAEALSRGLNPTHLLQLLHQHADAINRVPTPLLTELECRIKNYGRVRLYTDVTLLEVADTLVMRELSATTPLEEQVVRTIHPTLLILKKQGAERIVQDLKRRGQVPLLHEEEDYGAE
jgi:Helicase conserved C-terminal domain